MWALESVAKSVSRETERLKSVWVNPRNLPAAESERVLGKAIEHEYNLFDLLRRPNVTYPDLMSMDGGRMASADVSRETLGDLSPSVIEQVEIAAKYSGYIDRQKGEVERAAFYEHLRLPESLDYMQVSALSIEARQKLAHFGHHARQRVAAVDPPEKGWFQRLYAGRRGPG